MGHRAIRWPGPPHRKQSPSRRRQSFQEWPRLLQNSHSPLVKQVEASTQVRAPPPLLRTPLRPPIQVAPRRRRAPRQDSPCRAAAPPPTPRRGNRRPSEPHRPSNPPSKPRSPARGKTESRLRHAISRSRTGISHPTLPTLTKSSPLNSPPHPTNLNRRRSLPRRSTTAAVAPAERRSRTKSGKDDGTTGARRQPVALLHKSRASEREERSVVPYSA